MPIELQLLFRMVNTFFPVLFALSFYVGGYLVRENVMLSAMFMLIGTMWMVVSKLDDILQRMTDRKLIIEVNNPPGVVSRIEVNGKPIA